MAIATCSIYELLESSPSEKDLKPGDIVTNRTYGPNATILKGTLIAVSGEQVTVYWWRNGDQGSSDKNLWDGSDIAKIVSVSRDLLYRQHRMHDKNIALRLGKETSTAVSLYVSCSSLTFTMSYAGTHTEVQFVIIHSYEGVGTKITINFDSIGNVLQVKTGQNTHL